MRSHDNADLRAKEHQGPYVNNGKLPRARNDDGTRRKKRSSISIADYARTEKREPLLVIVALLV